MNLQLTIEQLYEMERECKFLSNNIEITTRHGRHRILAVDITAKNSEVIEVVTEKHRLSVSPKHLLWNGAWVHTNTLVVGDSILTETGYEKVIELNLLENTEDLYDIQVDKVSEYYANGIVSHNSSILEAFDFALYGKVRGKKKKHLPNDALPNRYNKNLEVELTFASTDHTVDIQRSLSPSKLHLSIDHVPFDRSGKANVQSKIDELVGIDIDTFKSFISMSINDFKNFMVLTPEEKRMLLDRLFNLDMINELSKIIKEKKKNILTESEILKAEIRSYENALQGFVQSLTNMQTSAKKNAEEEVEQTKAFIMERRDEYQTLSLRVEKGTSVEEQLRVMVQSIREEVSTCNYTIQDTQKKINLLNAGKCPTCESDLTTDRFSEQKEQAILLLKTTTDLRSALQEQLSEKETKYSTVRRVLNEAVDAFGSLKAHLTQLKSKLVDLKEQPNQILNDTLHELESNITRVETRRNQSSDKLNTVAERSNVMDQLGKLFSEEGIKKSIINKIVAPINHYIKQNLDKLDSPFGVRLDDEFSAEISLMGSEIEADSLSTGEAKMLNLCILLAYLQLIRTKKHINVLFLDEVFSSIDIHNINNILAMLKAYAKEHKINVILIHHALLEKSYFDKIYRIEKDITSRIILDED